jgi:hypothetical protein
MRCTKQIEAAGAGGYPLSEVKQNGSKGSSKNTIRPLYKEVSEEIMQQR